MTSFFDTGTILRYGTAAGGPTAALADVDILPALATRGARSPNYVREHRALSVLSAEMAGNPSNMLQKLADVAVEVGGVHTAGVSLLRDGVFHWAAVAGVFSSARGGTIARGDSPCGLCVDRDATQLLSFADRHYPALSAEPRFVEVLVVPFRCHGVAVGTVWIDSHDVGRTFDQEDERLVAVLSQFVSAGWQLLQRSEAAVASRQRKDEFLATLGHELSNPVGAVVVAAALLRRIIGDDERVAQIIDVIGRQAHHVSRLMEDLLDIERIESGKLRLAMDRVDLRTIITDTIETRRSQIEGRRHALVVDLGERPVLLAGDPVRLAQVVSNLIDNAAKYTPEGGRIAIAVSSDGDEAAVSVRDTGVGIPAGRLQDIFEPFAQLPDTGGPSTGGLGLGLALARRLTEMHGGSVSAASRGRGHGSCFTVRLPVRPPTNRSDVALLESDPCADHGPVAQPCESGTSR